MGKQIKRKSRKAKDKIISPFRNYWDKPNYVLLGIGLLILILGFYLMTFGPWDNPVSLTFSPIVLLIAYLIVFPLSILYKKKNKAGSDSDVPSEN